MCKGISVRVSWHGVGHISICSLTIRNVLGNLGLKNMKLIKKLGPSEVLFLFLIVRNHTSTTTCKPVRTFHSFYTHITFHIDSLVNFEWKYSASERCAHVQHKRYLVRTDWTNLHVALLLVSLRLWYIAVVAIWYKIGLLQLRQR